ncbi:PEP-utilizing enzyme, partial [Klebsiella pneumoniae]
AREITPSDLAPLVDAGAAGLCMAEGGATSHVAILARSKGLPCLVALGAGLGELEREALGAAGVDPRAWGARLGSQRRDGAEALRRAGFLG